jgi:hypothetical protein
MPREVKVTCDQCGRDITSTGNCEDWRLALVNERIPHYGRGTSTLMSIQRCLDKDYYFCGFMCLKTWVEAPMERR